MPSVPTAAIGAVAVPARNHGSATADRLRQHWQKRLTDHHARVAAWLGRPRDAEARDRAAIRREARRLTASAYLLAGEGWFLRAVSPVAAPAPNLAELPPLILGAATDAELVSLIERAAAHQQRALSWLRHARNAPCGAAVASQRRSLLRGLADIRSAEQCLKRAQQETESPELG